MEIWLIIFAAMGLIAWLFRINRHKYSPPPEVNAQPTGSRYTLQTTITSEPTPLAPLPPIGSLTGPVYQIEYRDADGVLTERVIRLIGSRNENDRLYVDTFCYLANDERTFRADRMLRLVNHRTGATIDNPIAYFSGFAEEDFDHATSMSITLRRAKPGSMALLWIVMADSRSLTDDDADILLDFISKRLSMGSEEPEWDREFAKIWLKKSRPVLGNVLGSLGRITSGGREAGLIRDYADKLSKTDARKRRRERIVRALV